MSVLRWRRRSVPGPDLDALAEADEQCVVIDYTNHRGERAKRVVRPEGVRFGSTSWYPEKQWLLDAWDLEKAASRTFAMNQVRAWWRVVPS